MEAHSSMEDPLHPKTVQQKSTLYVQILIAICFKHFFEAVNSYNVSLPERHVATQEIVVPPEQAAKGLEWRG